MNRRPEVDVTVSQKIPTLDDEIRAQWTNVIGPAYVVADNHGRPLDAGLLEPTAQNATIWIACISGINLSYNQDMIGKYVQHGRLQTDTLYKQIVCIWRMALIPMIKVGVRVAVLNAIGCGAFLERFAYAEDVRKMYAQALYEVLGDPTQYLGGRRCPLKFVVLCFPRFDQKNNQAFRQAYKLQPDPHSVWCCRNPQQKKD